jgi:hypothetical protein
MEELTLTQSFSIIALNSMDSTHMTNAKKMSLRCVSAATILELYLNDGFTVKENKLSLTKDIFMQPEVTLYQAEVLKHMMKDKDSLEGSLEWWLKKASLLSEGTLKKIERYVVDSLKGIDLIEEIPNLLGCDLAYVTAGVELKEYRSNNSEYSRQTESIRAELLEDGEITDECIFMLWLLRESSCLQEVFSNKELENIYIRFNELYWNNKLAKQLFIIRIHHLLEVAVKGFLTTKKRLIKTQVGTGINFIFPVIERSQSVFIETEAWFSNTSQRLKDVKRRLEEQHHEVIVMSAGDVPLLKIDNILYEAIPEAIRVEIMIQGLRLRRYQM